jgi:UDP-N-acetylmuramoyl-tripeptide--D-alanyl-D-alanine ligase
MRRYQLRDILAGTGGELSVPVEDRSVFLRLERNSRHVQPGDVFLAVKGENLDGHQFVADALAKGAATAIVSREWAEEHPEISGSTPLILVDEPVKALQRWAAWRRDRMNVTVIGITGSVGKTSAKESIAAVLGQRYKVFRSPGNFNNEIGLPLSILDCPEDADIMVLEMGGAYAFGELTLLAGIAKPSVGVVTNIYPVHLERMGTLENIAKTKQELVEAIPADGFVVLNHDDARVRAMGPAAKAKVITYGVHDPADIRVFNVASEGLKGTSFWVRIDGEDTFVRVPFVGGPGVQIAIVALAVGHGFGMDISEMILGLRDPGIQVRLLFVPGPNGSQLIDDTYNASTPSVLAALGLLAEIPATRKIAVLGEMRELGDHAEEGHQIIGGRAGDVVDMLVTFGDLTRYTVEEAQSIERPADRPLVVHQFGLNQREEMTEFLKQELREGDVVLLKGANGLHMETIVAELRPDAGAAVGQVKA